MVPEALAPYLVWELSAVQLYGLFFLLGSFTVAALSDVKHLAAQREFVEVWALLLAVLAVAQVVEVYQAGWQVNPAVPVKWILIVVFSVLSTERVGVLFRLAPGDILASAAACALLPALLVPVFWILLKLLSVAAAVLLRRGRLHYPFMPVVTATTVVVLAVARWGLPALAA